MHTLASARTSRIPRHRLPRWPWALGLDVTLVLLFAALGRRAHDLEPLGLLETAWPFLAGLLTGWGAWRLHRAPWQLWPRGVTLWLTTVGVGMVLRALTGEGTAPSFVLVALGVLALLLLGSRAAVRFATALRARRDSP